ncbi:MAG: hypothetical protein A3B34_00265 [Candidatus Sungbacteria bacterium RIFCSPLOWO2_01_FULL_54_21]|uniref:DUF3105 domain-containing protein n=2 Tax=Candidatus Sungiibacteriota TaxID=1817917 RepID=A0A1G2L6D8_9BACT|nr:MAG: hypothetical protein A2679_00350 [Candidatus Sungbacteria bacterium RIFCSPHIGHO2_01_FULL_54_26]OHA03379.1 MAG: hypothetical protein A3C92_00350 [Candidatus Sungbacteria bacterium RIFCSPHIGHO2_02_FULL_53_17]OHA07227.1 MAG: hypothetical protein A3B34_00265 [Candidatus Sungbacteria bacterium RIFCSPLOWO2_01_FULL_54_21]
MEETTSQTSDYISKADTKRERSITATRRKRTMRAFSFIGAGAAVIALVVAGIWWAGQKEADAPGMFYPSVGQEHISLTAAAPAPYNSNPPSSGAHFPSPANWGVYDYEVHDRLFIHNMEHGGVWIAYRPTIATSTINDLKAIAEAFGGSKIVMAPRAANDADIAIVAWTRVLKLDSVGEHLSDEQKGQIRVFYKQWKNRGPEFVPDTMPGVNPKGVQ